MAELRLDPKLGEEVAETITNILNGQLQQSVVDAYDVSKQIGDDNPIVEQVGALCRQYETTFNEELVPRANKVRDNNMAYSNMARIFNSYSVAKVADAADMGTVKDNNYDAATNL